ncbi:hypothetical protein KEU06_24925 [Pseudaminobacter sp. 19-2017]|uniref:Uncharacterized protein n=1 Tax=Pseudaminobacter soli (ex Zhang et al. 2022) TaxID=2831468 RepID=A0A942I3V1_9HYPH|nr:hypothetical protein [Pseudaminobacter soli]MBS3651857.1 hypothetical protein [Pseudaminobacter soli]
MTEALQRLTADQTSALARRRRRTNRIILALLTAFVVTVYLVSFNHIRGETNASAASVSTR